MSLFSGDMTSSFISPLRCFKIENSIFISRSEKELSVKEKKNKFKSHESAENVNNNDKDAQVCFFSSFFLTLATDIW